MFSGLMQYMRVMEGWVGEASHSTKCVCIASHCKNQEMIIIIFKLQSATNCYRYTLVSKLYFIEFASLCMTLQC